MGVEIERKFLVHVQQLPELHAGTPIRQGYLAFGDDAIVRVRLTPDAAYLTIKGRPRAIVRAEFEYAIPLADAEALLAMCAGGLIEKTRHRVPVERHVFEIDVFAGASAGLVIAEVELGSELERFPRPDWLGAEVSGDERYSNAALSRHPYVRWEDDER